VTTPAAERPVVITASGQRCGSTLVQRLVTSHPDILVWGEHNGALSPILAGAADLVAWSANQGRAARAEVDARGLDAFIANLTPEPEDVRRALRTLLLELFHRPAVALGRARWGLKEVRYGWWECRRLADLFPDASFIHITRDPRDVLRSLAWWEITQPDWRREWTVAALGRWARSNRSFLEHEAEGPEILRLRLEDVVADPGTALREIARRIDVGVDSLDGTVLARVVHGPGDDGAAARTTPALAELDPPLLALLDDPELRSVAAAVGYAL
jgi:hypothetical protein